MEHEQSIKRWRSIAENPFDFVVVIDRDYKYRFVNHVAPGLRLEDLLGKATPFDFVEPSQHGPMRAALERTFSEGVATSYDVYVAPLDAWFSSIVGPIDEDGVITEVSILTRDITEAKRAVVELEESEHRLRLALDGARAGLFDMDLESGQLFYTPRFYELLGYEPGSPAFDGAATSFDDRLHPEDYAPTMEALRATLQQGEPFDAEYRLRTANDDYRWFHGRGTVLGVGGEGRRFTGILTDITERKEQAAERERLEAHLWQAQKMETLGTLAGGIAHDLNNALLPILSYAELGLMSVDPGHAVQEPLTGIVEAAERARDLLRQVLDFSRRNDEAPTAVSVPAAVETAARLVRATLPGTVTLEMQSDAAVPQVLGDVTQVHQIVANLCTNAHHALEGRPGRIHVGVSAVELAGPAPMRSGTLQPGTYVQIAVTDTGSGIAPEALAHILEPFYTSKGVGLGTGLGLSVVRGIVTKRGGAVDFESTPGEGATFRVYLPAADSREPAGTHATVDAR